MSEWISVKDHLPNTNELVLVFLSDPNDSEFEIGMIRSSRYCPDDWWFTNDRTFDSTVTHWMPLPEPPMSAVSDEKGK